MQTARDLVGALVELTPCVQDRQYDLQSTLAFLLVDVYGDTSTVVLDFDGVVLVDGTSQGAYVRPPALLRLECYWPSIPSRWYGLDRTALRSLLICVISPRGERMASR